MSAGVVSRPWIGDIALGTGLALWSLQSLAGRMTVTNVALGLCQTLPLIWRRSRPWHVLTVVCAAYIVQRSTATDSMLSPGPVFLAVAVYAVARHTPAPRSLMATGTAAAALLTPEFLGRWNLVPLHSSFSPGLDIVVVVLIPVLAWMLGSGKRRISQDAERLRRLTDQLHAEREISMARAVAAERARIARDLHDMVAHHVSAIAVQARAVSDVMADEPQLAGEGVSRIGGTADTVLAEMRRLLGLLTAGESGLAPEPSLRRLDQLTGTAEASGCRVSTTVDQAVTELPPALQLCAYRIVQEALTNVVKHAGPTDVEVIMKCQAAGKLIITVVNGPPASHHKPMAGAGLGLIGMRERSAMFGGTLEAGPRPGGGWQVTATMPVDEAP